MRCLWAQLFCVLATCSLVPSRMIGFDSVSWLGSEVSSMGGPPRAISVSRLVMYSIPVSFLRVGIGVRV